MTTMSMHDRDWCHDRPLRPPTNDGWRMFRGFVFISIAIVVVLIFGRGLWDIWSVAATKRAVRSQGIPTSVTTQRTTHRCIVDGTVVYEGAHDCTAYMSKPAGVPPPPAVASPPQIEPEAALKLTAYQREMLRSADVRIARDEANAQAEMMAMRREAAQPRTSGLCEALEREITSLDAWARQPLSGLQQDHIRARRQEARSRQAALRC